MPITGVGIEVEGAKELRRAIAKVSGPDGKKALRVIHKTVATDVSATAKRNVAPYRDTGALERSTRGLGSLARAQVAAGGARAVYAGVFHFDNPGVEFLTDAVADEWPSVVRVIEGEYARLGRQISTR